MAPISDMDATLLCWPHHSDIFSLKPRMCLIYMVTAHQCHSLHLNLLIHFWTGLFSPFVSLQMASPHGVHQVWYLAFSSQSLFLLNCVCVCSLVRWQGSDSELECVAPHWIGGQEFPTTKNSQTGSVNNQSCSSGSSSLLNTTKQPLI